MYGELVEKVNQYFLQLLLDRFSCFMECCPQGFLEAHFDPARKSRGEVSSLSLGDVMHRYPTKGRGLPMKGNVVPDKINLSQKDGGIHCQTFTSAHFP